MAITHQLAPQLKQLRLSGILDTLDVRQQQAVGGRLFDSVGHYAPFMLIGALNAVVVLLAIIVRILSLIALL